MTSDMVSANKSSAELAGRVAMVTGAAQGIGQAAAWALAERGASVALVDVMTLDPLDLPGLPRPGRSSGSSGSIAITADVTRSSDVQHAVQATIDRFGALDILVNNAGICPLSPFAEISEAEWDRVLAVNLKGAFLCCQAALPHLRQAGQRGRIINVASVAGQMGGLLVGAHYAASKAGLIGLSKSLARLLAPEGITVNCVAPGTTETDLTRAWSEEQRFRVQAQIPLGRFATAQEVAAAVCFLASESAASITGATLDVNGGLLMR